MSKSTNQHGVHSPFVYDYVTKCLYSKPKRSKSKTEDVLLKSVSFFYREGFSVLANKGFKKIMNSNLPYPVNERAPFDFVYFENPDYNSVLSTIQNDKISNNGMVLVNSIHQNALNQNNWEKLIALKEITVSIDMYHLGILFIRKEQEKEHFTIRI